MSEILYRAAAYIRKSYTDDKSVESESVANQRKLIERFAEGQPNIEIISEKVDDGVSGIIFDRPAFQEMMSDIKGGRINCVIVKDLSRLGREYIETGRFLRQIFPAYGVRFIAINDNIDTQRDRGDDLIVSVKSVFNDAYCRDISLKIRSALNTKRDNGDYVGACPIYGYKKSDGNHNQLVIDEYPAGIVRDIFRMRVEGMSALKIAETLNNIGALSPLEYKKDRGLPHPKGGYADVAGAKWSATTIIRILNDETYTGALIQGRQGTLNYKIKDLLDKPQAEWKRTEDAHEAIISRQDFDLAQRVMRFDSRTSVDGERTNVFSGLLICDSCGGRMTRKSVSYKGSSQYYYSCPTTKKRGCTHAAMLKETELSACVLGSIKAHITNVASLETILAGSAGQKAALALAAQYAVQIHENERQLNKIGSFKAGLYENMVGGFLSKSDYKALKLRYTADETRLRDAITILGSKREDALAGKSERLRWTEQFTRFEGLADLDLHIAVNLIQSIRVVSKTELQITFSYQDEYENVLALLQKEAA